MGGPDAGLVSLFDSLICPFPGLRSFEPDESHLFFGRESEIEQVLERLRARRFLAVLGPSGCGKSSLVKAGVLPRLHSFDFPQVQRWHMAVMKPQGEPYLQLARALSKTKLFDAAVACPVLATSPDGTLLAIAHSDGSVRVYGILSGSESGPAAPRWTQQESALRVGAETKRTLAFLCNEVILLGGQDGKLSRINLASGDYLGGTSLPAAIARCWPTADRSRALCLTDEGQLIAVDLATWQTNAVGLINGTIESVALDLDHRVLALGTDVGVLWLVTLDTPTPQAKRVAQLESAITALAFSPSGHLAVGTEEGVLQGREFGHPDPNWTIQLDHAIERLDFSGDDRHLAAGGRSQVSLFCQHEGVFVPSAILAGGSNVFTFVANDVLLGAALEGGVRRWELRGDGWQPQPWLLNPEQATVTEICRTGNQSLLMVCEDGEVFLRSPDGVTSLWQLPGHRAQTQRVLESILRESRRGLVEALATAQIAPHDRLLLVVDQFEELFTFAKSRSHQESFINLLLQPLQEASGPASRVYVMLTMRSDYLKECHQFRHLPQVLNDCQYLVPFMSRAQFEHAIRQPLLKNRIPVDDALICQILNTHYGGSEAANNDSVSEQFDQLPLLQHLLARIWQEARDRESTLLDMTLYDEVGGSKALDKHLQRLTAELPEALVKRVFQSLANKDQGRSVRRNCTLAELIDLCGPESEVRRVVDIFRSRENSVLLPPSAQPLGLETSVEISHEAVLRQWVNLDGWLVEETHDASELQRLVDNYRRQERSALSNPELRELLSWWAQRRPSVGWTSRYQGPEPSCETLEAFLRERKRVQEELDQAAEIAREARRSLEQRQAYISAIGGSIVVLLLASLGVWFSSVFTKDTASFAYIQTLSGVAKVQAKVSGRPGLLLSALSLQLQLDRENPTGPDGLALWVGAKTGWHRFPGTLDPMQAAIDNFQMCIEEGLQLTRHGAVQNIKETILASHGGSSRCVAFSQDGRWLATGTADGTVSLWDLKNSQVPFVLKGHEGTIYSVAFSQDGRWLATGSSDKNACLWDLRGPDPSREPFVLKGQEGSIGSMAFSQDGHWLATCSEYEDVRLWDLKRLDPGEPPHVLEGHKGRINSVAFSPDGHWLATGSDDKTARSWDLRSADPSREPLVLTGHEGPISSLAFQDGRWLATGSADRTVRLWDLKKNNPSKAPLVIKGHEGPISSVAFSLDGFWLATGSDDKTAILWNLKGKAHVVLKGHEGPISSVAFSLDGFWLATSSADRTVRLWDIKRPDPSQAPVVLKGHEGPILSVAFSKDGRWLVTGSDDNTARMWDLKRPDASQQPLVFKGQKGAVRSVAFSQDERWLATRSADLSARLWDLKSPDPSQEPLVFKDLLEDVQVGKGGHFGRQTGETLAFSQDGRWLATSSYFAACLWDLKRPDPRREPLVLKGQKGAVRSVAFSQDGRWLATGKEDGTVSLWDLNNSQVPLVLKGQEGPPILSVAFSQDGRWLATGSSDKTACVWNLMKPDPSREPLVLIGHESEVIRVALSQNGRLLATCTDGMTARLWDLDRPDPSRPLYSLKGQRDATFSPDGRWLATCSDDNTVGLRDVTRLDPSQPPVVLKGHEGTIYSMAFSQDGRWLATSVGVTQFLWDLRRLDPSQPPLVLKGQEGSGESVAFSQDGHFLVTGSDDHPMHLWDLRPTKLIDDALKVAGRKITAAEVYRFGLQGVPPLLKEPERFFEPEALKPTTSAH